MKKEYKGHRDDDLMPLEDIAKQEGLSRQAVTTILEKAYIKVRRELKNRGYRPENLLED